MNYEGMTDFEILDDIRGVPTGTTQREEYKMIAWMTGVFLFLLGYAKVILFWKYGV